MLNTIVAGNTATGEPAPAGKAANVMAEAGFAPFASVITPSVGKPNCVIRGPVDSAGSNFSDDTSCGLNGPGDRMDAGDAGLDDLTGLRDEQFRARAYAQGVDQYWVKPESDHEMGLFMESIEGLLSREAQSGGGFRGVTIAYNTRTKEEVDEVMKLAVRSGGRAMRPAAEAFWGGYAGYFADPDGHLWEVAWNPQLIPAG